MENFKIETKTQDNGLTLSAMVTKKTPINRHGFTYTQKEIEIITLANYLHFTKNGITTVRVCSNANFYPPIPKTKGK